MRSSTATEGVAGRSLTRPTFVAGVRLAILAATHALWAVSIPWTASAADDVDAAVAKANLYIELAKGTERAVDSWERYKSWVNLKTGPTGKERYISYGMYPVYDIAGMLEAVAAAANDPPATPELDAVLKRYISAYNAVAPVLNEACAYYDAEGYRQDGMAAGKAFHARMVPLATTFMAERDVMMKHLAAFVFEVEGQELAAIEAADGRTLAWHAANVMHFARGVVDVIPRIRPEPIDPETMDEMMRSIGPETSGEKFEEIMAGVKTPTGITIDLKRYDTAMKTYTEAVATFDAFAAENAADIEDLKDAPGRLLESLKALRDELQKYEGGDMAAAGPFVGQVAMQYFELMNEANPLARSRLRTLQ
ncbi:MAG: DUF3829 domain-containing protein [Hyphomicrobium sp.]|nr:DUF3829 domain-containing protein [Hyphomicrobium sp.]